MAGRPRRGEEARRPGGPPGAPGPAPAANRLPALPRDPFRVKTVDSIKTLLAGQSDDFDRARAMCGACGVGDGGGVQLRACDGCNAVRYCDRDCQRVDWAAHKFACKILASDREIAVRFSGAYRGRVA